MSAIPAETTNHEIIERTATTPMDLLNRAIERGCDADQLDKLVGMMERLEKNRAEVAFNAAMNAAQKEMPAVVKNDNNPHTKSRFANLEGVQHVVKPIYAKHGFALSFSEKPATREGWLHINCEVGHVGGCTRHYSLEVPPDGTGAKGGTSSMNAVQGIGSSVSYARRYLLLQIFNITVANEDNDGNGVGGCISLEETEAVNKLIDECKAVGNPVDFPAFLRWLKVETLADVPRNRVKMALEYLNKKKNQKPQPKK